MNITLRPDLEKRIDSELKNGEYESADALVSDALEWYLSGDQNERDEIAAAVGEGLKQAECGEGMSLEEFDQSMRRKYGIPG